MSLKVRSSSLPRILNKRMISARHSPICLDERKNNNFWQTYRNTSDRVGPSFATPPVRRRDAKEFRSPALVSSQDPCRCGCSSCFSTIEALTLEKNKLIERIGLMESQLDFMKKKVHSVDRSPRPSKARRSGTPVGAVAPQKRNNPTRSESLSASEDLITSASSSQQRSATTETSSNSSERTPVARQLIRSRTFTSPRVQQVASDRAPTTLVQPTRDYSVAVPREVSGTPDRRLIERRSLHMSGPRRRITQEDRNGNPTVMTPNRITQHDSTENRGLQPTPTPVRSENALRPTAGTNSSISLQSTPVRSERTADITLSTPARRTSTLFSSSTDNGNRMRERELPIHPKPGSLMDVLMKRKPQFVRRLHERQKKIKEAAAERRHIHEHKMQVAALVAENLVDLESALPILRQDPTVVRAFRPQSSRRRTERGYRRTAEFAERERERERLTERAAVRIIAHVFSEETRANMTIHDHN